MKRDQLSALSSLLYGKIRPRSLCVQSSKRHKASTSIKDVLDQSRNLDAMVHNLEESGTEPEFTSVSQMRKKVHFQIASKKRCLKEQDEPSV